MAAIEEEHHRASGRQLREALRRSRRIGQLEFWRDRSRHRDLADRHAIILSHSEAGDTKVRLAHPSSP
jgi:hypothetical protein